MFKSDCKWHHDYARLAFDTGFKFESQKSETFDKNRISSIDVDRIIDERDFATIENCIPHIIKFVLDPDQAQILDVNFVKTFRLSQLAIQYLLYCKKYLDNTLIVLKEEIKKVKEENKELNLFVDDLKCHISTLMKEIDDKPTFKCSQCYKLFSSEEFLESHIKRRHSTPIIETQTDKLQMEIKELKGRLNSAERMIQKEQNEGDNNELKKVEELQQKFEELRLQVQAELKVLQTQHNFQERYEKWFERMTLRDKENKSFGDLNKRRESTTQTDVGAVLQERPVDLVSKPEDRDKDLKQIADFGEALESKVTSSLERIENQMQSFWKKLNEMEMIKKNNDEHFEHVKPIRPRSKYSVKSVVKNENEDESPKKKQKKQISQTEENEVHHVKIVETRLKKAPLEIKSIEKLKSDDGDTTTSETFPSETDNTREEEPREDVKKKVKPLPVPRKRIQTPEKKADTVVINDELLARFRKEIEESMEERLQNLGVSPDWTGLPTRSFERAMEIVTHQANLSKKNYPNFDFIFNQIEKNISKKIEDKQVKLKKEKKKKNKEVERRRSVTSVKGKVPSPIIEIKNRKMYDTDSESEQIQPKENLRKFSAPYNAVIEELKSVTSKYNTSDKSDVFLVKEEIMKNEDQTKGVLKSYPSVGSLTKKKVNFNLEADDAKKNLSSKDGGSTTSITSSVFDPTPRKEEEKEKEKEKDIEDLSDFDFSDM